MARRCDLCNKKAVAGHNVSYSKRRTARRFMPNLRFITLGGQRIKTCMKCLKKLKNDGKIVMKKTPARIATPARQPDGSQGGGQSVAGGAKVNEVVKIEPEVKKEAIKIEKPVKKVKVKKKTVKAKTKKA